jgi:peptide/nickel transport system permease protein
MNQNGKSTIESECVIEALDQEEQGPTRKRLILSRVVGNKMLMVGGIIVIIMLFMALFAPVLTDFKPNKMNFRERFVPPNAKHLMGTDNYGRDIFSRILHGTRISIQVGLISVGIGMLGGIIFGASGGFIGGTLDNILMRVMDALLAFPPLLLAIGLVAAAGPNLMTVSVSIGVVYIPRFARVMRSSVLGEREKEYVEAARAIGQSQWKILFKHIGPSSISPVIVMGSIVFAVAIVIESSLSFLGVGLAPPTPSWGTMLNESRRYLANTIWLAIFPGVSITVAALGFNMLGDGLRDFLDPKY